MKNNPFLHAIAASVYIVAIVTMMQYLSRMHPDDDVLAPILFLSVFTLSAAVMGYLFLGQPIQLYLDGKKKEAVAFFGKTLGGFAVLTLIVLLVVLTGVF